MKQDLCAHGADPERLTPVPMGIDPSDWPASAQLDGNDTTRPRPVQLGYLGTLGAQRKLEVLVDTLALVVRSGMNAKLMFVGGSERPEDQESIERRARALGVIDRIEITGLLPRAQALQRMQSWDVALSPYFPIPVLESTSPTKLVEYLALGLPVVANRHPEQRAILRETRAGVCVPWGPQHFARGIAWLGRKEPAELRTIGQRGRSWVMTHRSYAAIAEAVERKYVEVLSN